MPKVNMLKWFGILFLYVEYCNGFALLDLDFGNNNKISSNPNDVRFYLYTKTG